ncbi:hypothetical protein [Bosea sp. F3-2]|nr:hypothetical protein [Bosea sp. F3-2]
MPPNLEMQEHGRRGYGPPRGYYGHRRYGPPPGLVYRYGYPDYD